MMLVGAGVGLACRLLPEHYQGPCGLIMKVLLPLLGAS